MTVEPLSAEDVALLCAEPRGTQLQIGALCFFEAAPLRDEQGHLRVAFVGRQQFVGAFGGKVFVRFVPKRRR